MPELSIFLPECSFHDPRTAASRASILQAIEDHNADATAWPEAKARHEELMLRRRVSAWFRHHRADCNRAMEGGIPGSLAHSEAYDAFHDIDYSDNQARIEELLAIPCK